MRERVGVVVDDERDAVRRHGAQDRVVKAGVGERRAKVVPGAQLVHAQRGLPRAVSGRCGAAKPHTDCTTRTSSSTCNRVSVRDAAAVDLALGALEQGVRAACDAVEREEILQQFSDAPEAVQHALRSATLNSAELPPVFSCTTEFRPCLATWRWKMRSSMVPCRTAVTGATCAADQPRSAGGR